MVIEFKDLWHGHPINESVQTPCIAPNDLTNMEGVLIRKGFPVFANQCAIRVGVALRRAGVQPSQISGCAHCSVHAREEMHFINASALAQALLRSKIEGIGPVEKISGADAAEFYPKIFGRTGLIFVQDYWHRSTDPSGQPTGDHIDVWNGYRSSAKWLMEWFSWLGYYSNYAGAREIWFWPVK
ncbi:MAG: type VI secretion system amidase effector protein Tae4 [Hyphomicrobium sp.]